MLNKKSTRLKKKVLVEKRKESKKLLKYGGQVITKLETMKLQSPQKTGFEYVYNVDFEQNNKKGMTSGLFKLKIVQNDKIDSHY